MDFTAISLDPGVTSGIVLAELSGDKLRLRPMQKRLTPLGMLRFLQNNEDYGQILICEDFEFRDRSPKGLVMTSAHLIGIVMAYAEAHNSSLYMQKAAYAKSGFYGNDRALKQAECYVPTLPHAMDAMRHFMQWFTFGPGYRYNNDPKVVLVR